MNALVSARKAEPKEDRDMVAAVAEAMCAYTLVHVVAILYITYQLRNKRSILQSRVCFLAYYSNNDCEVCTRSSIYLD